jgi:hypothetical protein
VALLVRNVLLRRDVVILRRKIFALYLVFLVDISRYDRNVYCERDGSEA